MKHIRGITLDLDDTLWDIWSVIRRAEVELHRHIESRYPRVASRYDADGLRSLRNQVYETRPDLAHDLTELRRYSFAMILEECDYDPAGSHDLMDRFLALRHDVVLYPDVLPALEALGGRYPIVALSNGTANIKRLAISKFFSGHVSAADAGVKKPDAKIFALGCEALDLEPASVLHVGDHPVEDVIGALDAGLTAVWVNRSAGVWEQQQKPSAEVTSMLGLVELLAR